MSKLENKNGAFLQSKREIFGKVKENEQLRGVVLEYDAQGTAKFDDEIDEKSRFETKTSYTTERPRVSTPRMQQ